MTTLLNSWLCFFMKLDINRDIQRCVDFSHKKNQRISNNKKISLYTQKKLRITERVTTNAALLERMTYILTAFEHNPVRIEGKRKYHNIRVYIF